MESSFRRCRRRRHDETSPAEAAGLADHSDYPLAAPAPDHFIPLLYVAGLAAASGETAHTLVDGYAMGSLSMVSYAVGCDTLELNGTGGAPPLPQVDADETNV